MIRRRPSAPGSRWGRAAGAVALLLLCAGGAWLGLRRMLPKKLNNPLRLGWGVFSGTTDNLLSSSMLRTALQLALKQSPYLHLAASGQPACTLQPGAVQMLGSIRPEGKGWRLELDLQDCGSGRDRLRLEARAQSSSLLPAAVDELAASLRRRLGEPIASLAV